MNSEIPPLYDTGTGEYAERLRHLEKELDNAGELILLLKNGSIAAQIHNQTLTGLLLKDVTELQKENKELQTSRNKLYGRIALLQKMLSDHGIDPETGKRTSQTDYVKITTETKTE